MPYYEGWGCHSYFWFQVHIDAHADDDSPSYSAGMPFFRYPKTAAEMSYFMQKNDVFVEVFKQIQFSLLTVVFFDYISSYSVPLAGHFWPPFTRYWP